MFVWTTGDLIALAVLLLVLAVASINHLWQAVRVLRCQHNRFDYTETSACDAICHGCGKDLGFIRDVRAARMQAQKATP